MSSLAGVYARRGARRRLLPKGVSLDRPVLVLQLANLEANRGNRKRAEELLALGAQLRTPSDQQSEQVNVVKEIRRAQILRDLKAARAAIREAPSGSYSQNTALIIAGWLLIEADDVKGAEALFLRALENPALSWLYRAEALCGLGVGLIISRRKLREAFVFLTKAQFVFAVLGLLPIARGTLRIAGRDVAWSGFPGEVILACDAFASIGRRECTELRMKALRDASDPLQAQLFSFLGGAEP